jgi:iron(III) transport system ATP-binding protein
MPVSIELQHVSKVYGATRAADDVTLAIEPGELFFLLGPSGCGKTTLLRCIAGFCRPDRGAVLVDGEDITDLPPHERDTGMVFQSYALWPHMSVRQNVAFGLEMRRLPKDEIVRRTQEALALVRMTDRAQDKPNQLSGGQQQRVALARALVVQPKCLLLDEPLSNLDAKLRLDMRAEIRRICKQSQLTAVYVTHDQKEALSIADRLAVLDRGKVQQTGRPQDIYRHPANRFVAHFIGETNFLEGTVAKADRERVWIETPLGPMQADGSPTVQPGAAVVVSLRPEIIRLDDPPPDAPNVFDGHVHDTAYLGEMAQQQVDVPAREDLSRPGRKVRLKAFEMNPHIVARETPTPARIWFRPEDLVVLEP